MKKRLLWMIDGLGPGGAENLMPGILKNITAFDQRVCVLQEKQKNPIAKTIAEMGIPVDLLQIPNLRHPANLYKILRYFKKHKPHILHTQLEFSNSLGTFAARIYGIPSLCTLHTLDKVEKGNSTYWRHKLMRYILKKFSTRIIAVSESTRQHYIKSGALPEKKIITMYNGIDLAPFSDNINNDHKQIYDMLNIAKDSRILITVAVLREPKGIQNMLQAMPHIMHQFPNTVYLIVGDGSYAQHLKSLATQLGVQKNVRFTGFRNDVAKFLAISDIFVLPTLDDALPTVLIEAMAACKPLIASNVGGVPELLQDQINGLLVPPDNVDALASACIKLLTQQETATQMAKAGKKIAEQEFDVKKQAQNLEKLYQEILTSHDQ